MTIDWKLEKTGPKALLFVLSAGIILSLALLAASDLVVGIMTDERVVPPKPFLDAVIGYFPNSPRLNAQMAGAELAADEGRDLNAAEFYARRAANLSPHDFTNQLLMATVAEAKGDRQAAEEPLQRAVALAPNNADVHWRFGNLLLRRSKAAEAFNEFRAAAEANARTLPSTLDLIWRISGGRLDAVQAVVPDNTAARFGLAEFLLGQKRAQEAAAVVAALDRTTRLQAAETPKIIGALIAAGEYQAARDLWFAMVSSDQSASANLMWNDGFDADTPKGYNQFDWSISSNNYAQVAVDRNVARTGTRSVRVEFNGRDTTRLDGEFKQLVPVRPGARYKLAFFAKTDQLVTPFGPQIAVMDAKSARLVAGSEAVAGGTSDWKQMTFEFVAPADVRAVQVMIKRTPKYSYDDPTRGTIWFDDFTLVEQK